MAEGSIPDNPAAQRAVSVAVTAMAGARRVAVAMGVIVMGAIAIGAITTGIGTGARRGIGTSIRVPRILP